MTLPTVQSATALITNGASALSQRIADALSQPLTRISMDRRVTVTHFANVTPRPGTSRIPRRLMSDIGFLQETQFSFFNPHAANFSYSDTEDAREIKQLVIVPYGVVTDLARLRATTPRDRNIHSPVTGMTTGVTPHPDVTTWLMSAALNAATVSADKTQAIMSAATSRQGPTPHFIVDRSGNIMVGPSIDATVSMIPTYSANGVIIAVETALIIPRADHARRNYDNIQEVPFTDVQLTTLATLIGKLFTALPSSFPRTFTSNLSADAQGLTYVWPAAAGKMVNFADPPVIAPFEVAARTPTSFVDLVAQQGTFDLPTQIWQPPRAPAPVAGREEARQALSQITTTAEASAHLGAYATIAAGSRSNEMQFAERQQVFVQRQRSAHQEADAAGEQASVTSAVGAASALPVTPPANVGPHAYDFDNGLWGDGGAF